MKRVILFIAIVIGFAASGCAATRFAVRDEPLPARRRIYFEFGKFGISLGNQEILASIASDLKKSRKAIVILEGHTDAIGSMRYNEILAERRARSVRVALRDLGVDPSKTTIISKGKRDPAVPGSSREANKANRRVEVIYALSRENQNDNQGRKP